MVRLTCEIKADLLDLVRIASIIDLALDCAGTGLFAGVVEYDNSFAWIRRGILRADDLRTIRDFKHTIRVLLPKRDILSRDRGLCGWSLFSIALEIGADLDGTIGDHFHITIGRHIADNIHAGLLSIEIAAADFLYFRA